MSKQFLVDLKDLAHEKISFEASFEPGVVDFASENVQQVGPLKWTAAAERAGNEIRIAGSLNTNVELPCSRCLEASRIAISKPFDLFFRERDEVLPMSAQGQNPNISFGVVRPVSPGAEMADERRPLVKP